MPRLLEDVWYVPNIGRHLFLVQSATAHRISVVIKRQWVLLQHDGQLVTTGGWMMGTYTTDRHVAVQREQVEVNIATISETLQLWHERLDHQDKCHMRKVLEGMEINISMAETEDSAMDVFWVSTLEAFHSMVGSITGHW